MSKSSTEERLSTPKTLWSKVIVFLGSTREVRLGERVAKFIIKRLRERKLQVEFVGKDNLISFYMGLNSTEWAQVGIFHFIFFKWSLVKISS